MSIPKERAPVFAVVLAMTKTIQPNPTKQQDQREPRDAGTGYENYIIILELIF